MFQIPTFPAAHILYLFCRDGVTRCGLVCAVSWLVDMIAQEQEVDVFTTVRHIRLPRQQMIPDMVLTFQHFTHI